METIEILMKILVSVKYFLAFWIVKHKQINQMNRNSDNQVNQMNQINENSHNPVNQMNQMHQIDHKSENPVSQVS